MIITVATDFFIKDVINGIDELIARENISIRSVDVSSAVYQRFISSIPILDRILKKKVYLKSLLQIFYSGRTNC